MSNKLSVRTVSAVLFLGICGTSLNAFADAPAEKQDFTTKPKCDKKTWENISCKLQYETAVVNCLNADCDPKVSSEQRSCNLDNRKHIEALGEKLRKQQAECEDNMDGGRWSAPDSPDCNSTDAIPIDSAYDQKAIDRLNKHCGN